MVAKKFQYCGDSDYHPGVTIFYWILPLRIVPTVTILHDQPWQRSAVSESLTVAVCLVIAYCLIISHSA